VLQVDVAVDGPARLFFSDARRSSSWYCLQQQDACYGQQQQQ
jgi:hypothetical protein